MKVVVGRSAMRLEEAIPDWSRMFPEYAFEPCLEREEYRKAVLDADVVIGGMNRDTFVQCKNLKWIQASSTGINNYMDIPELVASDCLLTNVRGTHGGPLSESVFGMIFAFTRELRKAGEMQKKHEWFMMALRPHMKELRGSTMAIIGFGGVGRTLARRAAAFDMRILALDKYPRNKPDYVAELWDTSRLDDICREADYLVMCAPYTKESHHMISTRELGLMKDDAMIVIISRGGLIDEGALTQALKAGKFYAAAIDVFEDNVLAEDSELWDLPNVIITPHIAGGSHLERDTILEIITENLDKFRKGDLPLRNQIDMNVGF